MNACKTGRSSADAVDRDWCRAHNAPLIVDYATGRFTAKCAHSPAERLDCKDCGDPVMPHDVAQGFTTCAGCAEARRDIR